MHVPQLAHYYSTSPIGTAGAQPYAALVTFVHSARRVNLVVWDAKGQTFTAEKVLVLSPGEAPTETQWCSTEPWHS